MFEEITNDSVENIIPLQTVACLVNEISNLYNKSLIEEEWEVKKNKITNILNRVDLLTNEINKFTYFDCEKPYTRNLIFTNKHFTLLLLCWNPLKESKIHNHPCDGCFIKCLRGCIKEARYDINKENNQIVHTHNKFYMEGQVSYMSDDIGLHKVGNPHTDTGAVTLHLYTPPFQSCKVWSNEGKYNDFEDGKVGFYSVNGFRTPHLEGYKTTTTTNSTTAIYNNNNKTTTSTNTTIK